jgi:DUF4097 and DUF4098 domain-containing protein YvlB
VEAVGGASDISLHAAEGKARVEIHYTIHGFGSLAETRERELLANPPVCFLDRTLRVGPEPEGVDVDYVLFLPPEAEVEVEVGSGDVQVSGFSKSVRIRAGSGDIELTGISGEVHARCGSGDIELRQVFGAIFARTGSGDLDGQELKGHIDVETGSGDVSLKEAEGELRILTGSGDVEVEGVIADESWRIRTGSGDVHLSLVEPLEAEIFLQTEFGDIDCEFPLSAEEVQEGRLKGHIGEKPKARIWVETATGDIALTKR